MLNENPEKNIDSETSIGTLQLYGDTLTKFNGNCQNAVVEADSQPKAEVQVKTQICIFLRISQVKCRMCAV